MQQCDATVALQPSDPCLPQNSDEIPLATLPVGTEVSAKYKGAFCEAKVKKVGRQVKCRVTYKQNLGTFTLCELSLAYTGALVVGCPVEAKHPEKGTIHEAVVNKIYDQSQYTVVFDDGDIATLKRNSLHMKSGKHFNASESLDNLPLTHPEHFGTPVGGRRKRMDDDDEDEDDDDSSEDEADMVPYITKLGSVVCVDLTDKKNSKTKENWFPGLIVSPHAQDQRKINTKEDFLIRSFRDHRYFTVPRKECKKYHKDSGKKVTEASLLQAIEHANAYLVNNELLPDHWDREILFNMRDESSTEGSSEDEDSAQLSDDEDMQSPEEKDHLVAELYKHMDDRGTPINRTPCIVNQEVDLYTLFRLVQKLGGNQRVTNNNQWRLVAKRLGFETNWCVNQVRVCYKRYLQSFEELYKQLGCTLINHPRGNTNLRVRHGSGRPLVRGVRVGSKAKEEEMQGSDRSSISSQEGVEGTSGVKEEKVEIKEELPDENEEIEIEARNQKADSDQKSKRKADKVIKEEPLDEEMEVYDRGEDIKETKKKNREDIRMTTRPRRDSTSSLSAAVELKAKKDGIDEGPKPPKESKKKSEKSKDDDDSGSGSSSSKGNKIKKEIKKEIKEEDFQDEECNSDLDVTIRKKSKTPLKNKSSKSSKVQEVFYEAPVAAMIAAEEEGEEMQHLEPNVECQVGDKIKVFWRHGQIYEAKIMKAGKDKKEGKYYVHYQGWNQRYDEWITRGKIAENLTWNENPKSRKGREPKADKSDKKGEKKEKIKKARSEEEEEKQDTDEKNTSEEEKEDIEKEEHDKEELEKEEPENEEPEKEEPEKQEPEKKEESKSKKMLKRAKSVTPTSTPSSSRTSSPASMKRTKSPASKKAMSPSVKDKTPIKEKKKDKETPSVIKRTASPAPLKSPMLKRQSSRTSVFKQSDDNEDNEEAEGSDSEAQEEKKEPRRSNRGEEEPKRINKGEEEPKRINKGEEEPKRINKGEEESRRTNKGEEDLRKPNKGEEESRKTNKGEEEPRRTNKGEEDLRKPNKGEEESRKTNKGEEEPRRTNKGEEEPRRSNRGEKEKGDSDKTRGEKDKVEADKTDKKPKPVPRSNSITRAGDKKDKPEAETDEDAEGKKISDSIISQPSVRLGKMKSLTPIKKNAKKTESSDPYVFQEPDDSPSKFATPTKSTPEPADNEGKKSKALKREEADKTESESEMISGVPEECFKILTPVRKSSGDGSDSGKGDAAEDKKPFLQMTDQYATLFPHLASLRAHTTDSTPGSPSADATTTVISSASIISEIVESSIIKSQSDPDEKERKDAALVLKIDEKDDDDKSSKDTPSPSKKNKNKKTKKRSMRVNPSHKSREVVSDSDTDSESEDTAKSSKPMTPSRRKTTDSDRAAPRALKRMKQLESDEEASTKKRLKRRKDDDTSLMCEETIPRSPQPPGGSENQDPETADERSGSRLEMPFATVPQSVAVARGAGQAVGRALDVSSPATPESTNSGEVPLTIDSTQAKEDGSKSPAESSEVDMESLSGQGKAGSEDSRLDIEFSSSSDTRRASRGSRRQIQQPKKELQMQEVVKSPETAKRKRKVKPETPGRGRGKGRGRSSSGVGRGVGRHLDDEDAMDTSGTRDELGHLDRLDNAALAALAQPKPNSASKYNFYVQLDPAMEPTERISKLQGTLELLRKTYLNIKGDLSAIERRRKKIRRKERDRSQQATEVAA